MTDIDSTEEVILEEQEAVDELPKVDLIALDIAFYKANRLQFIDTYPGKYLLIKGEQVVGVYKSNTEALAEGASLHEVGTFIIEHPVNLNVK